MTLPHKIGSKQIGILAKQLNIKEKYTYNIFLAVAESVLSNLDAISEEMHAIKSQGTEKTLIKRLHQHIKSNTKSLLNRYSEN
ncbi:MAG: hypothetical protein Q8R74_10745 [Methylophilus sp.]|nr:hypothetical protein [Methylophilus sp.]